MSVPSTSPPQSPLVVSYSPYSDLPYVECLIYREDTRDVFFHWAGLLQSNPAQSIPQQSFELSYEDTNDCNGEFKLYMNTTTGQGFVWFDMTFGYDLLRTYTGGMIQIPHPDS